METRRLYLDIVNYTRGVIASEEFFRNAIRRQSDFSRRRKMSFADYIHIALQNAKSSLQISVNSLIDAQKSKDFEYSKQAFSKGRQRIKPEAFQTLFRCVVERFYKKAELTGWNGYHLFGIDGTRLNLPCTDELVGLYGTQTSQGAPQMQALVSCVYDLLNGIIVDTRFAHCKSSERTAAKDMITSFHVKNVKKPVFVMDRGYPSAELLDAIESAGHKFIMRCPTGFLRSMEILNEDNIIKHQFKKLKRWMKVRVIKIKLSADSTEYLITNILDSDISVDDFRTAYWMRWGIESKYNDIKNKLEIENFTGYSSCAILQDFYATMFLANLAGVLEYDLHEEIEAAHRKPENRYQYKMNIAAAISVLKKRIVEMLSTRSARKRECLFAKMAVRLAKEVVPVRLHRSYERKRKHTASKYSNTTKRN